jgi:hypothetical protein
MASTLPLFQWNIASGIQNIRWSAMQLAQVEALAVVTEFLVCIAQLCRRRKAAKLAQEMQKPAFAGFITTSRY